MIQQGQGWRCLWDAKAYQGESLLWDDRDGCLYWVDIGAPSINWYDLASGDRQSWVPPQWVSALAVRARGGFVASCADGFAFLDPKAGRFEPFLDPRPDTLRTRLNDGVTDRHGRYWSGSCDNSQWDDSTTATDKEASLGNAAQRCSGELYRLDASGMAVCVERDILTANGPAFSPDGGTMYFNDSMQRVTRAYDLAADGSLSNRRDLITFQPGEGFPDGMAVDIEGGIWIALFESWVLRRYSPEGLVLDERRLPVRQGMRPAFGGEGRARLFLSSGSVGFTPEAHIEQPLAGGVFEILQPGVCGVPETPFAG